MRFVGGGLGLKTAHFTLQAVLGGPSWRPWLHPPGALSLKWVVRGVCTVIAAAMAARWALDYLQAESHKLRYGKQASTASSLTQTSLTVCSLFASVVMGILLQSAPKSGIISLLNLYRLMHIPLTHACRSGQSSCGKLLLLLLLLSSPWFIM